MSRSYRNDPSDEVPLAADHPPGEPTWLRDALPDVVASQLNTWESGLPTGHEPVMKIDGEEVPISSLRLRAIDKTREYGVSIVHKAGEHPKITAAATTITVFGLIAALKTTHSRNNNKKGKK